MTEEEINVFWRNQKFFTPMDIVRASNGTILVKPEAMAKVAQEYHLDLPKAKIYTLREARSLVLNAEIKRREVPLQDSSALEKTEVVSNSQRVADYFKIIPESKKKDLLFISKELNRIFFNIKPSEIESGIKLAAANGLVEDSKEMISAYHNQLGLRAISINFEKLQQQNMDTEELVNRVAGFMFNNYIHGYNYGQLRLVLNRSSLSSEVKAQVEDRFYELLMPEVVKKYQDTKLRGSLLAKDIMANYESFDMERIFAILDVGTENLQIDRVRYETYRLEDEPSIINILLEGSRKKLSAEEIVSRLEDFESEYPKECILATICDLRSKKLILPYDDIINGFLKTNVSTRAEEVGPELPVELEPADRGIFDLSPVGEFVFGGGVGEVQQQEDIIPASYFKPVSNGKRHKVLKREKAVTSSEKKAVIAALIVAAGAISTAVLTSIFGVSPIEAAKNTAASIGSFTAGNAFLSQIIPKTVELVKNLSVVGVATAGTVAWLRRRNAKKKEQRKREIVEVLDEVMREREEAEKGGMTR